ncbi:MAG: pilus assembly protein TadG-related protein [Mycobacteriales bacterium]
MLLIIFYTFISMTLVLLAIDAADVFLNQRELMSAADGAALAAAQSVDRGSFYAGGSCVLPISLPAANSAAAAVLADTNNLAATQVSVGPGGHTVTVTLDRQVTLPLQGLLGALIPRWSAGVPVRVSASARSPLTTGSC